jgi:hypothetical protein
LTPEPPIKSCWFAAQRSQQNGPPKKFQKNKTPMTLLKSTSARMHAPPPKYDISLSHSKIYNSILFSRVRAKVFKEVSAVTTLCWTSHRQEWVCLSI